VIDALGAWVEAELRRLEVRDGARNLHGVGAVTGLGPLPGPVQQVDLSDGHPEKARGEPGYPVEALIWRGVEDVEILQGSQAESLGVGRLDGGRLAA
jgi:hypothetical protein